MSNASLHSPPAAPNDGSVGQAGNPQRNRLEFSWLMKLRFAEIAGQTATILGVAWLLEVPLPLVPLLVIVTIGFLSNVAARLWFQREHEVAQWHLAAVMTLDVLLLTGLLYLTGGPGNPFSFLYLVQIALAAVVLRAHWTWMLVALSFACFGVLLLESRALTVLADPELHDVGMWVALGVASLFIVYFLWRVVTALTERERELADTRERAARQERLASLATMAAGAGHELATPLGTVALVAKELEHALGRRGETELAEDARLIREQVGRCRMILDQMAGGAGEHPGEGIEATTVAALVTEAVSGARPAPEVTRAYSGEVGAATVQVPPRAVAQALRSLVTNAQDASPSNGQVVIRALLEGGRLTLEVEDQGAGMSPEILGRIGEPFFTTKEPGHGMGLGLFLTRAVAESLGGTLAIDSERGRGTRVTLELPVEVTDR